MPSASHSIRLICPAQSFEPHLENGLLTVDMTNAKGMRETVRVALRCAQ